MRSLTLQTNLEQSFWQWQKSIAGSDFRQQSSYKKLPFRYLDVALSCGRHESGISCLNLPSEAGLTGEFLSQEIPHQHGDLDPGCLG